MEILQIIDAKRQLNNKRLGLNPAVKLSLTIRLSILSMFKIKKPIQTLPRFRSICKITGNKSSIKSYKFKIKIIQQSKENVYSWICLCLVC